MRLVLLTAAAAVCLAGPVDPPARAALHTIPVEIYRNSIWLQVGVNGSAPLTFMLDSAAGGSVVARDTAERLGMHIVEQGSYDNVTPSETAVRVAATPNVEFSIGDARFTNHAGVIGMELPNAVWGRRFEGVIGAELFAKYIVELDWEKRQMRLFEPSGYKYTGGGQMFPVRFIGKNPTITGTVRMAGKEVEANLLIDSAASSTLLLSGPFVEQHAFLRAVEAAGGRLIEGESIGAGGSAPSAGTRSEWLQLGPYRIPAPLTTLSKAKAGSLAKGGFDGFIGANVLRRFRITFDFPGKRVWLEPNACLSDPDISDGTGIRVRARGTDLREYYVHAVAPDTPAANAGVRSGDVLVSINGEPVRLMTMEQIARILRGPGLLVLVSDREGQTRETRLEKRPLL